MYELIASIFTLLGATFVLLAAVGIWRFPDVYCRMHAAAKAGSFGAVWLGVGACVALQSANSIIHVIFIILAVYLTAPVACHLIARMVRNREKNPEEDSAWGG